MKCTKYYAKNLYNYEYVISGFRVLKAVQTLFTTYLAKEERDMVEILNTRTSMLEK